MPRSSNCSPRSSTSSSGSPLPHTNSTIISTHRVTHKISLSALRHNYSIISSAASRQQCSVICVVKADGYGHGAIETSLHLADHCGADAFAVATVDEGVALRKALNKNNGISVPSSIAEYAHNQIPATIAPNGIGNERKRTNSITGLFHPPPSVYIGENTTKTSDTSSIGSAPLSLS